MKTEDCFHTVSLVDLWDRFEEDETLRTGRPEPTFVPQATPDKVMLSMKKSAMILMRKTVLVALEMEPAKRDEFLALMHAQYLDDAKRANVSCSEAQEWADYLDQRVCKTINAIGRA